ncbi:MULTISPECIES: Hsp70 family protein [unclassified Crossiella]|uniref:Hsp70 family protein n=1 Tax=unclassified Crossiella TaxID=2620835 RepID=UPI001FFEC86F|nr:MULTISPECIES: Hsp70 family protein [unclassified Crossiella]MCK2242970.1 Hsp70 family protein [Crossiella sp. S99.2]MCK2256847.1 Hsp70 family protein [Crossiella sp. S99.1]
MSDTIDFGIDLGTTNSAMAVFADGEVTVIKNNEGWDYTPSAVWMSRAGEVRVGRRAKERLVHAKDWANVHLEFKQEMGLAETSREFPAAGVSLTPPELSARVLRSLRADAEHQLRAAPAAAVITVPAAFRLHQNEATSAAAALAGFGACPLVQEPTAAAFAYGFQNAGEDAYWMVFDFGGGTFDAAVVSTYEGELRVLDHAGDPHLGGKLIDWAIVDQVLAPAVAREFRLDGFTRDNKAWLGNFAKLKHVAEEAKIALSREEKATLEVDLVLADGSERNFEFTLRRDEVDRIAEPFYVNAISLCRGALAKANLDTDDIDRLLLVGGATLAPGLRARLADPDLGLGIELDHSQDPTTVVARGAAVFASTVPGEPALAVPVAGQFILDAEYPRTTGLTEVAVAGRFRTPSTMDWDGYEVVLDNPAGQPPFCTPNLALDSNGGFLTEVVLGEQTTSTFTVSLINPAGHRETVTPKEISIRHWLNEPGGTVLTNSLGLGQADGTFHAMLVKGARLPAVAHETFQTTVALRRTDAEALIRIPIVEGERGRADRNMRVGMIEIRPRDVRLDLPMGTDVEITFEVDENRRVGVIAEVPLVDEQFEAQIDLSSVRAPEVAELERAQAEVETRLAELRADADRAGSSAARTRLTELEQGRQLEQARCEVRAAHTSAGSAAAADQKLREIQAVLDEVETDVRLPALLAELTTAISALREMVRQLGDAEDRAELAEIERRAEIARRDGDPGAVEELLSRLGDLEILLLRRDGTLDIQVFHYFRQNAHQLTSRTRARELIREGEQAIARNDLGALPGVNQRLRGLMPATMSDPRGGVQARNGLGGKR